MNYLGDFPTGDTVYVPFQTFDSNGASVTITGLAVTDIEIYKNGGTTQRSSDAGYTLLDTDGIDFDSITGIHGFSIDLSDNTDAGFYAAGNEYWVVVSSITADSQTVNFVAATFSIERSGGALALLKDATYGLSAIETLVDDLETRLTAARAGYLDNLSAGAVAQASALATAQTDLDTLTGADGAIIASGQTVATVTTVTNQVTANVTAISSDSVAADNLEAMLDGTGGVTLTTALTGNITGNLSGSVGSVTGAVGSVTGAVGSVTGAVGSVTGNVGGNVTGSVGSLAAQAKADVNAEVDTALADANLDHLVGTATGIPAIPAGTFLDQIMDDGTAVFDRTTDSLQAIRDRGDSAWPTATTVDLNADQSGVTIGTVSTLTGHTVQTGDSYARLGAPAGASIAADIAALNDLSAADVNAEVVDVLRTDTIPDSYAADGAQPTIAQAILAIQQFLTEKAVSGTTVTVKKPDGSTTAMTFTLDDATDPTSITRAT